MKRLHLACIVLALGLLASAQSPKSIVVKDYDPNETWPEGTTSLLPLAADVDLLPQMPGARAGKLWIRMGAQGLVIVGAVDGPPPEFSRNKNHILEADHIEVWLAFADDIPMPPIGYGNQFGPEILASEKDCEQDKKPTDEKSVAKCTKWYQQQIKYRARFKKLFTRQWLITDYYHEESFTTPAYQEIVRDFASDQPRYHQEIPLVLKPTESAHLTAYAQPLGGQPGYRFNVNIPWESMPPVNTLDISRLRLLVEVYSPAPPGKKYGPYSSTAPGRKYGKPDTFNLLRLETPHKLQLSPCGGLLEVKNNYDERVPGWVLPAGPLQPWNTTIFGLTNEALGYMYGPDGLSPIAFTKKFFFQQAGPDQWVCGPEFKYRKGSEIQDYGTAIDEQGFAVQKLPDGTLLVKEGPFDAYSTFGSGQCGACATARLSIYAIGQDLKLTSLLELSDFVDESKLAGEKSEVSPDWGKVTVYQETEDEKGENWSSTLYCRAQLKYTPCGGSAHVQPPPATE